LLFNGRLLKANTIVYLLRWPADEWFLYEQITTTGTV